MEIFLNYVCLLEILLKNLENCRFFIENSENLCILTEVSTNSPKPHENIQKFNEVSQKPPNHNEMFRVSTKHDKISRNFLNTNEIERDLMKIFENSRNLPESSKISVVTRMSLIFLSNFHLFFPWRHKIPYQVNTIDLSPFHYPNTRHKTKDKISAIIKTKLKKPK